MLFVGRERELALLQSPSYPPQVQRVALAGLSEEEIGQLIEALGHESSAALVARIHRESGGNPFFAAEIVRALGTAEVGIPGNVRDAISHRLRRLSEGCRRMLGVASVIGPEFEFATLERVAAELGDCRPPLQLGAPEREFLAIDLPAASRGEHREVAGCHGSSAPPHAAADVPLPYFDAQSRREYAQRLRDLRAAATEAEALNDVERARRDGRGSVTVDEIITLVNIALGNAQPAACPNGVPGGAEVDVVSIIQAVNSALSDCDGNAPRS